MMPHQRPVTYYYSPVIGQLSQQKERNKISIESKKGLLFMQSEQWDIAGKQYYNILQH